MDNLSPQASIKKLPGIGTNYATIMFAQNVCTIEQLAKHHAPIPGLNPERLKNFQTLARNVITKYNEKIITLEAHSWFNRSIHVIRSNGNLIRATCGSLVFHPNRIMMHVSWPEKNKGVKKKKVSPGFILSIHKDWLVNDVVSDEDELDKEEVPYEPLPQFKLLCSKKDEIYTRLDDTLKEALSSLVMEINAHQTHCNKITHSAIKQTLEAKKSLPTPEKNFCAETKSGESKSTFLFETPSTANSSTLFTFIAEETPLLKDFHPTVFTAVKTPNQPKINQKTQDDRSPELHQQPVERTQSIFKPDVAPTFQKTEAGN